MASDERGFRQRRAGGSDDPPKTSPMMAQSNVVARSFSLVLFIIAILLCLAEMEIAFVTFMILGLAIEFFDLICGMKESRRISYEVTRCVNEWRARAAAPK